MMKLYLSYEFLKKKLDGVFDESSGTYIDKASEAIEQKNLYLTNGWS
jgi:hypothetical protein